MQPIRFNVTVDDTVQFQYMTDVIEYIKTQFGPEQYPSLKISFADECKRFKGKKQQYIERSCSSGNLKDGTAEIIMGYFDEPWMAIAAFFHELGHLNVIETALSKFDQELRAWEIGWKLMNKYKNNISSKMITWAVRQIATYDKAENIGAVSIPFTIKAIEVSKNLYAHNNNIACPYCGSTEHSLFHADCTCLPGKLATMVHRMECYCWHCHKPFIVFHENGRD